ncbi:MAG: DinB family protein [Planctomycetota bacterium]
MDEKRLMLRHFLASIAYRTQKALRGAPEGFFTFRAAPGVRTPMQILRHMASVLGYGRTYFTGGTWKAEPLEAPEEELKRIHDILKDLRSHLEAGTALRETTPERMLQGPFSDAMTHAGQLTLLRRLFGSPVPPENFIKAAVDPGNLEYDQPDPVSPDERWRDAEGREQR